MNSCAYLTNPCAGVGVAWCSAASSQSKASELERKRKMREEAYKRRYASGEEAKMLEQSTFRRLYGLQSATAGSPSTSQAKD